MIDSGWVKKLKPGDKVSAIRNDYDGKILKRPCEVVKTTKTRVVTTFGLFMVSTGVQVGDRGACRPWRLSK